ncbi:hypothetical protein VE01_02089 [Pseudogymnoascus verrucosus]|uniref:Extracellular membrane protein CFEM domain-containing protein n=1 Tax=Pseudogymnoascus verrucosus TaxID=342668 RepID=A0A1B8GVE2_9PEZI|nr:uncharacterized protein VE01_02089 [Pseudogymnoascus verrucosus]OBT99786.1 hypothetical protein VE01_02089 [Pseudogymnoascus verrucosus]
MRPSLFIAIYLTSVAQVALCQKVYINQVPEYSQLPACAEVPLSTIVRNMVSGCGDNHQTTSYGCFCVSSSAKFDRVIGTAVASRCTDSPQEAAASALSVFDNYCHLLSVPADNTATATAPATGTTQGPTIVVNSSVTWQTYTPVRTQAPIPSLSAAASNRTNILAVLAEIVCIGMLFNLLM